MDVSKITAIVKLIETGHQHEEAGEQREAVKAYADAYKGMQDTLVEVHTLWVEAYQEMTRQAGPDFESTIPQAAEDNITTDEVTQPASDSVSPAGDESLGIPADTATIDETADEAYHVLEVSRDDVVERGLSFKAVRSNPFAQAAKDLAAAVVEAATDVAAAVVDVRSRKSDTESVEELHVNEDEPSLDVEDDVVVAPESRATDEVRSEQEPIKFHVNEQDTADHKIAVLESLLEQVRSRKNP